MMSKPFVREAFLARMELAWGPLLVRTRPQRVGRGLYRPQNGCMEQWVLWAPEAQDVLFYVYGNWELVACVAQPTWALVLSFSVGFLQVTVLTRDEGGLRLGQKRKRIPSAMHFTHASSFGTHWKRRPALDFADVAVGPEHHLSKGRRESNLQWVCSDETRASAEVCAHRAADRNGPRTNRNLAPRGPAQAGVQSGVQLSGANNTIMAVRVLWQVHVSGITRGFFFCVSHDCCFMKVAERARN